jgi:hypothetical protein
VEEGRGDGLLVEPEFRHDGRHGHRMGDVGLPRTAELPLVGPQGRPGGLVDDLGVALGAVLLELLAQGREQLVERLLLGLGRLGWRRCRCR